MNVFSRNSANSRLTSSITYRTKKSRSDGFSAKVRHWNSFGDQRMFKMLPPRLLRRPEYLGLLAKTKYKNPPDHLGAIFYPTIFPPNASRAFWMLWSSGGGEEAELWFTTAVTRRGVPRIWNKTDSRV